MGQMKIKRERERERRRDRERETETDRERQTERDRDTLGETLTVMCRNGSMHCGTVLCASHYSPFVPSWRGRLANCLLNARH